MILSSEDRKIRLVVNLYLWCKQFKNTCMQFLEELKIQLTLSLTFHRN
jgi:hypothetical protein